MTTSATDERRLALPTRITGLAGRVSWPAAVLVLLVVALLALAGERAMAWREQSARVQDHDAAVAAAEAEVEGLIGISASTSAADMDALLDGATAAFRDELEAQADRLRTTLRSNQVAASGEVVSAAVTRLEADQATVIVAAVGSVENKSTTDAEPRNYRLKVDLQRSGSEWLVAGLEFVA